METELLKQPLGCLRVLQWFLSVLAFSTCCHFTTYLEFIITLDPAKDCHNEGFWVVEQELHYPFNLEDTPELIIDNFCNNGTYSEPISFPGDFSSGCEIFVFTGVVTWLYCFVSLAIYVFSYDFYVSTKAPHVDFYASVVLATFWLASSSAWAYSLNRLKGATDASTWFHTTDGGPCRLTEDESPVSEFVLDCRASFTGAFFEANVSVTLGFLNTFLWMCGLWYLVKETHWLPNTNDELKIDDDPNL